MTNDYGIPAPRGVRKDWDANSMGTERAGELLRRYAVPATFGDPTNCVAWFDRFGRARAIVAHYANGRTATVRLDANRKWRTTFGEAA